ncbi:hypothetical protein OBBRIDRAFT_799338 [Obba rivulosa]|uniref:Uncharacterized protein n=1 Tax=Obba rivulosa TaxID=1052685 RepID=A0A8E2AH82_9APHY|nr:hypothetical protein OBBRIDRAFT_799338 [Obba rivulosa]
MPPKKIAMLKTRLRPLKAKGAAVVSAVKTTFKVADEIAQLTQMSTLQAVTGIACKIIECCETMKDNKEQAIELAGVAREIVAALDAAAGTPRGEAWDKQLKKDVDSLAKVLLTVEKSMSKIASAKRFKKLFNLQSNAKKIKDGRDKLKTAFDIFQTKNSVGLRTELAHHSSHVDTVLRTIGNNVAILQAMHGETDQRLAIIEDRIEVVVTSATSTRILVNAPAGTNPVDPDNHRLDVDARNVEAAMPCTFKHDANAKHGLTIVSGVPGSMRSHSLSSFFFFNLQRDVQPRIVKANQILRRINPDSGTSGISS